jgi:hypothetical protein
LKFHIDAETAVEHHLGLRCGYDRIGRHVPADPPLTLRRSPEFQPLPPAGSFRLLRGVGGMFQAISLVPLLECQARRLHIGTFGSFVFLVALLRPGNCT